MKIVNFKHTTKACDNYLYQVAPVWQKRTKVDKYNATGHITSTFYTYSTVFKD